MNWYYSTRLKDERVSRLKGGTPYSGVGHGSGFGGYALIKAYRGFGQSWVKAVESGRAGSSS